MKCLLVFLTAALVTAQDKVEPGEFVVGNTTLINLGFEWHITGDNDRNAKVDVSYRKQGQRMEASHAAAVPPAR